MTNQTRHCVIVIFGLITILFTFVPKDTWVQVVMILCQLTIIVTSWSIWIHRPTVSIIGVPLHQNEKSPDEPG